MKKFFLLALLAICGSYAQAPVKREINIANDGTTGTTLNTLTKVTGAPSVAIIAATTDTGGVLGVTSAGAGTTGSATIVLSGPVSCVFDGATTAGNYVQISGTVAGNCDDVGATIPTSGQIIGRVLSTNATGGTYSLVLFGGDIRGSSATMNSLGGQTGATQTITRGPGIGGSSSGNDHTFTTASGEADFLASGALTCGASTQGKMQVHTTPLQYCDNAGTPALQYTAYGNSAGAATSVAAGSVGTAGVVAALKTFSRDFTIFDPVTGDSGRTQIYFGSAVTITRVACAVKAATSVTINLEERAEATPDTAGTAVLTSNLVCDTNTEASTTFSNAGIAARVPLALTITAVSGTPDTVRVHVEYTID